MNHENNVLALYALFAGVLLLLIISVKVYSDHKEKRRSPRFNFPKAPMTQDRPSQTPEEEHTLIGSH